MFSKPNPDQRQWFYDFCQRQKPYLLNTINNNMGAITQLHYTSSTHFYLEDKHNGHPWVTQLPFPVQVLQKVESIDEISNTRLTSLYSYHHGYYDGEEREFRGFGRVDRQDTETYKTKAGEKVAAPTVQSIARETYTAPSFTKSWYHTGAWFPGVDLKERYRYEFFQGDAQAKALSQSIFDYAEEQPDPTLEQQAHRALQGSLLRTELYGLDVDHSSRLDIPYSVGETCYAVKLLQSKGTSPYAIFLSHPHETIAYNYERNAADPRITQDFVLNVDHYGHVLETCHVAYGRRQGSLLEQTSLKALYESVDYIHKVDLETHLLGLPKQTKAYEIPEISPEEGPYFSFADLKQKVEQSHSEQKAELLSWARHYYYDPETGKELALGIITPEALLVRSEHVQSNRVKTQETFEGIFTPAALDQLLTSKDSDGGGYVRYSQDKDPAARRYYWNPGSSQMYGAPNTFYLPTAFCDPFGHETQYEYDQYHLLVTKVTDAIGSEINVEGIDYQTLNPQKICDLNNNISEARFDPLGMVILTSHYGTENGKEVGFTQTLADIQLPPKFNMEEAIAKPQRYLQRAASYFYYDLLAWKEHQKPVHAVNLVAETYAPDTRVQTIMTYSEGFGREVKTKLRVEAGTAFVVQADGTVDIGEVNHRWLCSGHREYNNKGNPIREYEPYYTDTYQYLDHPTLKRHGVSSLLRYDPLDRLIRVDLPKGFFTKVEFTPWQEWHYDENDTVKKSKYYRENIDRLPPDSPERQALEQAARFYDTPELKILDNLGRTVQDVPRSCGFCGVA